MLHNVLLEALFGIFRLFGTSFGGLFEGLVGGLVGGLIGGLVGGLVEALYQDILWTTISTHFCRYTAI